MLSSNRSDFDLTKKKNENQQSGSQKLFTFCLANLNCLTNGFDAV